MFKDEVCAQRIARLAAVSVLFAVLLARPAARAAVNAQQVQIEIDRQGAGWTARDSWVSQLDENGARRLLGAPAPARDGVVFSAPQWFTSASTAAVDWRAKDGVNWVSPILNQANCGSCVAFATVATLETQINIASALPWLNPRFSTQALFACGGGGCESGWMPSSAASYLVNTGIPDEACAPYTMGATGKDVECSAALCSDASSRTVKIASFSEPSSWGGDRDAVKTALQKGPLMTTLSVYADFMSYGSGVYKHVTGSFMGGHAVSIIGFDDSKNAWIIRNSWGTDWGTGGFGYVSYDDSSGIGDSTWKFEPAPAGGFSAIRNLRDRDYLAGDYAFHAVTTVPGATGTKATVVDRDGKTVASLECGGVECELPFATAALADGRYELRAASVGASGPTMAQPRYFFISNQKPVLAVEFQLVSGDLAKPLKGRVEFTVKSSSSTAVPLSGLDFVALKDGKEVVRRHSDIALPTMTTGWRTNLVASGTYEIFFVARVATNLAETAVESRHETVTIQN